MEVTVKLFASLNIGRFKEQHREYPARTTLAQVVRDVGVDEKDLGGVLLNGQNSPLDRKISPGDAIALVPIAMGG